MNNINTTRLASFIEDKIEVDVVIGDDTPIVINSLALAEAIISSGIVTPPSDGNADAETTIKLQNQTILQQANRIQELERAADAVRASLLKYTPAFYDPREADDWVEAQIALICAPVVATN